MLRGVTRVTPHFVFCKFLIEICTKKTECLDHEYRKLRRINYSELGKTQLRQGSMRISAAYIRNNPQFKHGDPRKIDPMVFSLADCALGTEVPLLAYDLSERLPSIWRPAQDELLCTLSDRLDELQPDSPEPSPSLQIR